MADNVLIQPPAKYDQAYMRQLNRRIEELLRGKQDKNSIQGQLFSGVPNIQLTGTNAALVVPLQATPYILPFNVLFQGSTGGDFLWNGVDGFSAKYPAFALMFFRLNHFAQTGGAVDIVVHGMVNGASVITYAYTGRADDVYDISDTFFPQLPVAANIQLGLVHNRAGGLTINMTKSKWSIVQLTPDPRSEPDERWNP